MNVESLLTGLENGEFVPVFQTYHDSRSLDIRGVEILARWAQPDGRLLCPKHFILSIEDHELHVDLTLTLLREAMPTVKKLETMLVPFSISLNISVRELFDPRFSEGLVDLLLTHDFPTHKLVLELKDAALIGQNQKLLDSMASLKKRNVVFAIDSYSLKHAVIEQPISDLFNELKIDANSVVEGELTHNSTGFVDLITLAQELELTVSMKGVENYFQVDHFADLGCNYLQGYVFNKPMQGNDLIKYAYNTLI